MTLLMTAKIRLFFGTGKQLRRKVRIDLQLGGWIFIVFDFPSREKRGFSSILIFSLGRNAVFTDFLSFPTLGGRFFSFFPPFPALG